MQCLRTLMSDRAAASTGRSWLTRGGAWPLVAALVVAAAALAGCATDETSRAPVYRPLTAAEGRALVAQLLPANISDRSGWATDIYAALAAMDIPATPENICAVIAVTEQESSFRADPAVPGLSGIAWKEIDRQAERAGVPMLAVRAALLLPSPHGRS